MPLAEHWHSTHLCRYLEPGNYQTDISLKKEKEKEKEDDIEQKWHDDSISATTGTTTKNKKQPLAKFVLFSHLKLKA